MSSPEDNRWKRRFGAVYPLFVAVQFLTRIPVPRDLNPDRGDLADSVVWFPAVGVLVGGLLGLLARGLSWTPLVPAVAAVAVVAAGVALTGAFHEDGLGDALDGLVGGWGREQMLEIMRDSRIGTYGTVGLVLLLGTRVVCLAGMEPSVWGAALVVAHTLGRTTTPVMIAALPYARGDGEDPGVGGDLGPGQSVGRVLIATAIGTAVAGGIGGWAGVVAAGVAMPVCAATGLYYRRKIGGVTGDCLGATNVAVELATLVAFALLHPAVRSPWTVG